MSRFILLLLVLIGTGLKAQTDSLAAVSNKQLTENEGVVRFAVDVDNGYFEVLVNDTLLIKRFKDTLKAGTYQAKVWSPGYITATIEFEVVAGKTTTKYVEMAYSNAKQQFEQDYSAYRKQFHKSLTLPASLAFGSAMLSGTFMILAYDKQNVIKEDIVLYNSASKASEVVEIKDRVEKNNRLYNVYRSTFYVGTGLTFALIGTTIYSYSKFKKNHPEPVLNDKSPWHDRFSLRISPVSGSLIWHL